MKRDVMDTPYTLYCTKNRASFERKLKEYAKEIDKMFSLIEIAPNTERYTQVDERLTRLQDAVAHFKRLS